MSSVQQPEASTLAPADALAMLTKSRDALNRIVTMGYFPPDGEAIRAVYSMTGRLSMAAWEMARSAGSELLMDRVVGDSTTRQ